MITVGYHLKNVASQTILIRQAPMRVESIGNIEYPIPLVMPGNTFIIPHVKYADIMTFIRSIPNSITSGLEVYMLRIGFPISRITPPKTIQVEKTRAVQILAMVSIL